MTWENTNKNTEMNTWVKFNNKGVERFWLLLFYLAWVEVETVCDFIAILVFDFHLQARFIVILKDWKII